MMRMMVMHGGTHRPMSNGNPHGPSTPVKSALSSQAVAVGILRSVLGVQRSEGLMGSWGEEFIEKGRQQGWLQGLAEGEAKGRAKAVLKLLTARGVQEE